MLTATIFASSQTLCNTETFNAAKHSCHCRRLLVYIDQPRQHVQNYCLRRSLLNITSHCRLATGHAGGLFAVPALFPFFIVMFSNVAKLLILSRYFGPLNLPMFGFTSPARGELMPLDSFIKQRSYLHREAVV